MINSINFATYPIMTIRIIIVLVVLSFGNLRAFAQNVIELMDAVQLIEDFEKKIAFIEYEQRTFITTATENDNKWLIQKPIPPIFAETETGGYSSSSAVAFAPSDQWFLVSSKAAYKASFKDDRSKNDLIKYFASESRYCYDGELFKHQNTEKQFGTPPKKYDSKGDANWGSETGMVVDKRGVLSTWEEHAKYIGDGRSNALEKFGKSWGLCAIGCMAWTDFEAPVLLSRFLRKKIAAGEKIIVRETSKDNLEIFCPIGKSHAFQYSVKFIYDAKLGRINRVEWGGCVDCKGQGLDPDDWWANRIGILEYDDDSVLPSVLNQIELPFNPTDLTGKKCTAFHLQFIQRKVLEKKKDKEFFTFEFSPGIELDDYINKRIYVVGKGLEDDIASTRKFMEVHDLFQSEVVEPRGVPRWLWLVLVVGLVALAGFLVRRRFVAVVLAFGVVCCQSGGLAWASDPVRAAEQMDELGTSDLPLAKVRQCGHVVVAATCCYFQIDVDTRVLQTLMKPTDLGTSLLQIKQVLEVHGLKVVPKKCLSLESLVKVVSPSTVVIVPFVMPNGRGHYAMVVQKDKRSTPLLVDVLTAVAPITDTKLTSKSLNEVSGVVLLVTKQSSPMPSNISIAKSFIDLGDIVIDDDRSDILDFTISINNESERPALVEFRPSCGCIQPRESTILIDAKGTHSAQFSLSKSAWGLGEIERVVEVVPKNGPRSRFSVRGRGIRRARADQGILLSTDHMMFETMPYTSLNSMQFVPARLNVKGSKEGLETLVIASVHDWVKVTKGVVVSDDILGSSVSIELEIAQDRDLFDKLKDTKRQYTTSLLFSTDRNKQPAELRLTFVRPSVVNWRDRPMRTTNRCEVELFTNDSQLDFEVKEFSEVGNRKIPLLIEPTEEKHRFKVSWPKDYTGERNASVKFTILADWGSEVVIVSCESRS
jgi:hypothetical protein